MTAGHIADHRVLLPRPGGSAGQSTPALDAVVVPAARASRSIVAAIEVARLHEATLVVLSSRASAAAEVHRIARRRLPAERIVAVDLPDRRPDGMPALATDRIDTGGSGTRDTGLKRNLGLRLAVLLGWGQILFMDDDVSAPPDSVLRASRRRLAERGGPGAIGWAFDDFPDNSVACHAHRLAGGRQGTFVGAGGLLLRVDERLPHFPTVYNEDWLFFADLLVRRERGLALGGTLRQRAFDPFADPDHARVQEFGDLLGEGLFALLHRRKPLSAASSSGYWADYLNVRRRFLHAVESQLMQAPAAGSRARLADRQRALDCVTVARHTLMQHRHQWELDLPAFVKAWRQDAVRWGRTLARTTGTAPDVDDALARLGLVRFGAGQPTVGGGRMPRSIATVTARVRSSTSSLVNTLSR